MFFIVRFYQKKNMQSRRVIPQMVGGIAPVRCDTKCVHLTGVGGLTKEKIFNKITHIFLLFNSRCSNWGDFRFFELRKKIRLNSIEFCPTKKASWYSW